MKNDRMEICGMSLIKLSVEAHYLRAKAGCVEKSKITFQVAIGVSNNAHYLFLIGLISAHVKFPTTLLKQAKRSVGNKSI